MFFSEIAAAVCILRRERGQRKRGAKVPITPLGTRMMDCAVIIEVFDCEESESSTNKFFARIERSRCPPTARSVNRPTRDLRTAFNPELFECCRMKVVNFFKTMKL
ncbi:hypothetical protein CDAR_208761 [Caerostris darwini]|uniref:Uncharacterized protein n=1 Tax=Caerostris darwini TaxID=1538125 RepID=A0AAV4VQQ1_9ARAC|nr:hypothetical protein CDAR_208761 [Caerostris darwini]